MQKLTHTLFGDHLQTRADQGEKRNVDLPPLHHALVLLVSNMLLNMRGMAAVHVYGHSE